MVASTGSTTYKKGKLYDINLNDLQADLDQPRKVIDAQALEDMTASIGKLGVIQPIIFRVGIGGSVPHTPVIPEVSNRESGFYIRRTHQ